MNSASLKFLFAISFLWIITFFPVNAQHPLDAQVAEMLPQVLKKHREFVSLPNIPTIKADMYKNFDWVTDEFERRNFSVRLLESTSLPVFLAERTVDENAKTLLVYFHIDGQGVDPANWDQEDPFIPVLKEQENDGNWTALDWEVLDKEIDPEWRIFGRAAADDKAPIMMMLTALEIWDRENANLNYNLKIMIDPQEESGSHGLLSTLEEYKEEYKADYMLIMDGPAHPSNKPTLTFGFRGNSSCSITMYGAKLPQHSGHYGNYAPNPVFALSHLLAGMKDEDGRVTIDGFYDGITLTPDILEVLNAVPDDENEIKRQLGIHKADLVGENYQQSLQYPSLNVRHIETSWKGPGLKTIIPEVITAHLDVRLVKETDGAAQIEIIRQHLINQGYFVIDRAPTEEERLNHDKIVTFKGNKGNNAYRSDLYSPIATKLRNALTTAFGEPPVSIRTMGGTVPLIDVITALDVPTIIVPMVNMDNNQHNPNENIRIGNMIQGIKICHTILSMDL